MKWRDLMSIKETKFEVENRCILLMSDWCTSISSFCKLSELTNRLILLQRDFLNQLQAISCEMCGIDNVERVLPLRLRGGALSVYQRLTRNQREDLQQVKQALLMAFAPDPFVAFDTFVLRRSCPWEIGRIFG